jgi:hypothetical protein
MPKPRKVQWLDEPADANYPAAQAYLSLILTPKRCKAVMKDFADAEVERYKAKDLFRASGLSLLGVSNAHVQRDIRKIRAGKPLSPLLLLRVPELAKLIVADGYHRLCAVYSLDENVVVPCKVV